MSSTSPQDGNSNEDNVAGDDDRSKAYFETQDVSFKWFPGCETPVINYSTEDAGRNQQWTRNPAAAGAASLGPTAVERLTSAGAYSHAAHSMLSGRTPIAVHVGDFPPPPAVIPSATTAAATMPDYGQLMGQMMHEIQQQQGQILHLIAGLQQEKQPPPVTSPTIPGGQVARDAHDEASPYALGNSSGVLPSFAANSTLPSTEDVLESFQTIEKRAEQQSNIEKASAKKSPSKEESVASRQLKPVPHHTPSLADTETNPTLSLPFDEMTSIPEIVQCNKHLVDDPEDEDDCSGVTGTVNASITAVGEGDEGDETTPCVERNTFQRSTYFTSIEEGSALKVSKPHRRSMFAATEERSIQLPAPGKQIGSIPEVVKFGNEEDFSCVSAPTKVSNDLPVANVPAMMRHLRAPRDPPTQVRALSPPPGNDPPGRRASSAADIVLGDEEAVVEHMGSKTASRQKEREIEATHEELPQRSKGLEEASDRDDPTVASRNPDVQDASPRGAGERKTDAEKASTVPPSSQISSERNQGDADSSETPNLNASVQENENASEDKEFMDNQTTADEGDEADVTIHHLQELPPNKACADCDAHHPDRVNITVGTFICALCAHVHEELLCHSVKRVYKEDTFTAEDLAFLKETNNLDVNEAYLLFFDPELEPFGAPTWGSSMGVRQEFLIKKYIDKAWHRDSPVSMGPASSLHPNPSPQDFASRVGSESGEGGTHGATSGSGLATVVASCPSPDSPLGAAGDSDSGVALSTASTSRPSAGSAEGAAGPSVNGGRQNRLQRGGPNAETFLSELNRAEAEKAKALGVVSAQPQGLASGQSETAEAQATPNSCNGEGESGDDNEAVQCSVVSEVSHQVRTGSRHSGHESVRPGATYVPGMDSPPLLDDDSVDVDSPQNQLPVALPAEVVPQSVSHSVLLGEVRELRRRIDVIDQRPIVEAVPEHSIVEADQELESRPDECHRESLARRFTQ